MKMTGKVVDATKELRMIHLDLYLQFIFYWGTIAMGMVVNYYYAIPASLQPNATDILLQVVTTPVVLVHGIFGVLSTGMSIPIIPRVRKLGLYTAQWLHVSAFLVRMFGFAGGLLFIYFSTQAISDEFLGNVVSFMMASAFIIAVTLTFLSRISIYREDVLVRYGLVGKEKKEEDKQAPKEFTAKDLSLSDLKLIMNICYVNFVVYLFLYFSGMYINIWITSGVNTINIGDPVNIFHMIITTLNFGFSFFVMVALALYGMIKAAVFSLGAMASIAVSSVGGLLFLVTGGGRTTGDLTLIGGWVMSLIYMLAFFLSYYAALEVEKAIVERQIFGGAEK
jgi:MFS family permease